MLVLAHAGDWLVNLIYLAPVIVIVLWIAFTSIRDRRRDRRDGEPRTPETRS